MTISAFEKTTSPTPLPDEPNAAPPSARDYSLMTAKAAGISTWVSCELVLVAEDIYSLIKYSAAIDLFRIGKLNYHPSDINWGEFGRECERLCRQYGRSYYIKDSLRKEMEDSRDK